MTEVRAFRFFATPPEIVTVKKEYFPPIVVMIMGVLVLLACRNLRPSLHQPLGAAVYATIIVSLLLLFGIIRLADIFVRSQAFDTENQKRADKSSVEEEPKKQMTLFVVLIISYGFGFKYVGYFVSSFLFMMLGMSLLSGGGMNGYIKGTAVSLFITAMVYLCFKVFLNLYFPKALLF